MYYEINIAFEGRHFFATAPRSITNNKELLFIIGVFENKFPSADGYCISVSYHPAVSYGVIIKGTEVINGYYDKEKLMNA